MSEPDASQPLTLRDLWPTAKPDAAAMIRYYSAEGVYSSARSWALIEAGAFKMEAESDPVLVLRHSVATHRLIHAHDVVFALRTVQASDPTAADALAARLWSAADAGDSYGEWLWQWAEEAGIDVEHFNAAGATSDEAGPA